MFSAACLMSSLSKVEMRERYPFGFDMDQTLAGAFILAPPLQYSGDSGPHRAIFGQPDQWFSPRA